MFDILQVLLSMIVTPSQLLALAHIRHGRITPLNFNIFKNIQYLKLLPRISCNLIVQVEGVEFVWKSRAGYGDFGFRV